MCGNREETGSAILSLWFADGTNYPGQVDIRERKAWMHESLKEMYRAHDTKHADAD